MKKALAEADSVLAGAHRGAELELAEHASVFLTDYEKSGPDGVERIIARARASQWDIESSIPWDHTLPDYEAAAVNDRAGRRSAQELWGVEEWGEWRRHILGYTLSQLLHGEQIGILGSAREVELGQTLDVKTACSLQLVDETRHAQAVERYIRDRVGVEYPITGHLSALASDGLADSRPDICYIAGQVLVEGVAAAGYAQLAESSIDPTLTELLKLLSRDEARHMSFGVIMLEDMLSSLSQAELYERQVYVYEAMQAVSYRLVPVAVFEHFELDVELMTRRALADPGQERWRAELFSRVVPTLARIGLLDANYGWLRERLAKDGVLAAIGW